MKLMRTHEIGNVIKLNERKYMYVYISGARQQCGTLVEITWCSVNYGMQSRDYDLFFNAHILCNFLRKLHYTMMVNDHASDVIN